MKMALASALVGIVVLSGCTDSRLSDRASGWRFLPKDVSSSRIADNCQDLRGELARQEALEHSTGSIETAESPFGAKQTRDDAGAKIREIRARMRELKCSENATSAVRNASLDQTGNPPQETPITPAPATTAHSSPIPAQVQACAASQNDGRFDRCFKRCRQYTDRSKNQCFDACNASCP